MTAPTAPAAPTPAAPTPAVPTPAAPAAAEVAAADLSAAGAPVAGASAAGAPVGLLDDLWPVDTGAVLPALLVAAAGVVVLRRALRPTPRLAPRLRAYNSANRVRLGLPADTGVDAGASALAGASAFGSGHAGGHRAGYGGGYGGGYPGARGGGHAGVLRGVLGGAPPSGLAGGPPPDGPLAGLAALFAPMLGTAAHQLGRLVDRESDEALLLRLRQAGLHRDVPERERLATYRTRRLGFTLATTAAALGAGLTTGSGASLLACLLCGVALGVAYPRSRLDAAIARRRDVMRIDLATVNQQLGIYAETGASVDDALRRIVARSRGPVIEELAEVLTWRRAGTPLHAALLRAAELTAEPHAARTYRALAAAAEGGAPTGAALRHLSDDVRTSRRDALRRLATRRRAAMIIPLVVVLLPPLLLLVGAPIPALLTDSLR